MGTPVIVPNSTTSEEALIGAVMIDPSQFDLLDVSMDDFYIHRNQWIWFAFTQLHNNNMPIDFITVTEQLDKNGKLEELGGSAYLTKALTGVPSSLHAEAYAERVRETAIRRRMLTSANELAKSAYDETIHINDGIATAVGKLNKLTTVSDVGVPMSQLASNTYEAVETNFTKRHNNEKIHYGFQTGIMQLDRAMRGLKQGWLVYLAGSPGVGKSMLALQSAMVFAKQSPGCYVALEMTKEALAYRAYGMKTGSDPTKVEFGEVSMNKITKALDNMQGLDMEIFCVPRMDIQEFRAYVARQKYERDIQWVVLDYVSLLSTPMNLEKNEKDEMLSAELRRISLEYNVLLIGLDSVNKGGASGILSLEAISGNFRKQHDSDLTIGYSKYKAIGSVVEIEDTQRQKNCRLLGVLKDRHRGNGGRIMGLELVDGLIRELVADNNERPDTDWWHD